MDRGGRNYKGEFLAVGEAAWLYSYLLQALKGKHLSALGSQQRGLYFYVCNTPLGDNNTNNTNNADFYSAYLRYKIGTQGALQ